MELGLLYSLKAIHIIGFVAWFAGLFYLVRLFVYHLEADEKPEQEAGILKAQYQLMQQRVYKIIANPAMMLTWTAGLIMLGLGLAGVGGAPNYLSAEYGTPGWMHAKLLFLVLFLVYHLYSKRIMKSLAAGKRVMDPFRMRLFNEVPSVFLVGIVFLATLGSRGILNYMYWAIGLVIFIAIVYFGAKSYQRKRLGN